MSVDRIALDREAAVQRLIQEMRGEAAYLRRELAEIVLAIERVRMLFVRVLVTGAVIAIVWPLVALILASLA
jgi:hypothetical protein